jgi:hypothetical protein
MHVRLLSFVGCGRATQLKEGAARGTRPVPVRCPRVGRETIENLKRRMVQCRQLAAFTTDEKVAGTLLQMADDAEADLKRMQAEPVPTTIGIRPN